VLVPVAAADDEATPAGSTEVAMVLRQVREALKRRSVEALPRRRPLVSTPNPSSGCLGYGPSPRESVGRRPEREGQRLYSATFASYGQPNLLSSFILSHLASLSLWDINLVAQTCFLPYLAHFVA
jgi:hypothetical protein